MFHSISITRADSPLSKICIQLEEITAVCSFHMLRQIWVCMHAHAHTHSMPLIYVYVYLVPWESCPKCLL